MKIFLNLSGRLYAFAVKEVGAVTTDFVVITGAIVGLAIAVLSGITLEAHGLADDMSETVESVSIGGS